MTKKFHMFRKSNLTRTNLIPIFIIGVPRSGTTLLRVILDGHSKIAAASETPWILGGYGENSIRQLAQFLIEDTYGPVKNLPGVDGAAIFQAIRSFLDEVLTAFVEKKRKELLVLKTPDDIKYLEFLLSLYPTAKFIHIFRDGRDAACSAVKKYLPNYSQIIDYGDMNHLNAIRRWYDWELKVRRAFDKESDYYIRVKYEELVTNVDDTLLKLCKFIGVEFEPEMARYSKHEHDYPQWEAGSSDLLSKARIDARSIGKWRDQLNDEEISYIDSNYGSFLKSLGYGK